jgi:hypothetical protein
MQVSQILKRLSKLYQIVSNGANLCSPECFLVS